MCWLRPGKKISLSQLGKDPSWSRWPWKQPSGPGAGVDSSSTGKEGAPTQPEGTTDCTLTSSQYQIDFKKTIVKIFFLFHLGNGMLIINVTQCTFPLIVEFDACQILLVEALCPNSSSKDIPVICAPYWTHRKRWYLPRKLVSAQSGQVWGETLDIKDTLLPFMKILMAGPVPRAL
jgi:hypothetical protein